MAKCDEGYLCSVCGEEVEGIQQSDLYLRFVIGEMDPEQLHVSPETHISCNPVLAQFIDDAEFITAKAQDGEIPEGFGINELDDDFVRERRAVVTRGWKRLHELAQSSEDMAIQDYPLPEFRAKWQDGR